MWQVEIARLDFDNCPIYLLLLKDLIGYTDNRLNANPSHSSTSGRFWYEETSTDNDLEHPKLIAVHTLVSKSCSGTGRSGVDTLDTGRGRSPVLTR